MQPMTGHGKNLTTLLHKSVHWNPRSLDLNESWLTVGKYEDELDAMEEKVKLLQFRLKQARQEADDWRKISNALAHAFALLDAKKPQPMWMKQYYKQWESKQKDWWGV